VQADFWSAILWRMLRLFVLLLAMILAAACQSADAPAVSPTRIPFPTVTLGSQVRGILSTQVRAQESVISAATIAAVSRQPTATPNIGQCPSPADVELPEPESDRDGIISAIITYLSAGGNVGDLRRTLDEEWGLFDDTAFLWDNVDLTGEGVSEIVTSLSLEDGGVFLIFGCTSGTYALRYQANSDATESPKVITVGDINRDFRNDLIFMNVVCDDVLEECSRRVQVIGWQPDQHRFASLLGTTVISRDDPRITDMDGDEVSEIVVDLNDDGNADTGPLRTGVAIYDWNGSAYILSIWQPDPPLYTIQIIHEADRYLLEGNAAQATQLYNTALTDEELDDWYSDELFLLPSYANYRLLLARTLAGEPVEQLQAIYNQLLASVPEGAPQNVYMQMGSAFWERYQATNDISAACEQVLVVVESQPEALERLNRYGSRSPVYTAQDLCPF